DEKKQEYYRIIGSESERLGYLINNILDFSKMEAGKKVYHKSDVSINEVVQSVLETYRYTLDSRGFSWRSDLDPSNPVVHADRDAIAEVLINLIENAVKYNTEQKSIIVATSADGDQVQLSVSDKGIGIPEEHQAHIFDLFYRVESSLTHTSRGT